MTAKKNCYSRYRLYIENEIPIEFIAPIRQYWITDILDLIPGEFNNLDRNRVEQIIDTMLNEINRDYYENMKKTILNYVLKDDEEKQRIGIMEIIDEVLDYGEGVYRGVEPT